MEARPARSAVATRTLVVFMVMMSFDRRAARVVLLATRHTPADGKPLKEFFGDFEGFSGSWCIILGNPYEHLS
jgi:hypothetical protein